MDNRICVYTVCMNESRHVDSWVDSMKEADRIVALVHDCTDDTEEKLKSRGVIVERTHYDKWRFDVGKNDSMAAAMRNAPDCNILVFTSLDEIWDPGWAQILRDNWTENTNICLYKFVQSHHEDGTDDLVTGFNWIHSNDPAWYWKYPIDERIMRDDNDFRYVNLFDSLRLNHWPDNQRPRPYADLRMEMYREYRDDVSLVSVARDYHYLKRDDELFDLLKDRDFENMTVSSEEKSFVASCLADIYARHRNDIKSAGDLYRRAIAMDPTFRIPYLWYGRNLCDMKVYHEAEYYLREGLKTTRKYSWLESSSDYEGDIFIWLTVCTYYTGKYIDALAYAQKAFDLMPDNELARNNLGYCKEALKNIS